MADEEDVSEDEGSEPIELDAEASESSEGSSEETLVSAESARDRLTEVRENVELDRRHYLYAPALTVATGLFVMLLFTGLNPEPEQDKKPELNLTDYQEEYVDCPRKLIDTCTKMSKLPTEEVTYWKTQNDWIYMKMGDGRAIISTKPNGTSPGEFVTYMSAPEVDRMEDEDSNRSNSTA